MWRQVLVVGILQAQKARLQNDKLKMKRAPASEGGRYKGEETTPRTHLKVGHYKSEQMERRDRRDADVTAMLAQLCWCE
jgi:hypothetical protein